MRFQKKNWPSNALTPLPRAFAFEAEEKSCSPFFPESKFGVKFEKYLLSVNYAAPRGGSRISQIRGANPKGGGANLLFGHFFFLKTE